MYQAIVVLPLIGAIVAGVIALFGARSRFPGQNPPPPGDDHAAHAHAAPSPNQPHAVAHETHHEDTPTEPSAAGSGLAELVTCTLLVISCVLSWFAFYQVGLEGHDARITLFSYITFGDLHSEWALRVDSLTAVMLVVVTTISSLVHIYSVGY